MYIAQYQWQQNRSASKRPQQDAIGLEAHFQKKKLEKLGFLGFFIISSKFCKNVETSTFL